MKRLFYALALGAPLFFVASGDALAKKTGATQTRAKTSTKVEPTKASGSPFERNCSQYSGRDWSRCELSRRRDER